MATAEIHLVDGSMLIDHRANVGLGQLEQALNHWLEAGASPLLIHDDDASLTIIPRTSVLWIRVFDTGAG
jgi:hypothetical protein